MHFLGSNETEMCGQPNLVAGFGGAVSQREGKGGEVMREKGMVGKGRVWDWREGNGWG